LSRWVGFFCILLALPLFFVFRDGPFKIHNARLRARVGVVLFACGLVGLCLLLFGGIIEALAFLLLWGFIAWVYNL